MKKLQKWLTALQNIIQRELRLRVSVNISESIQIYPWIGVVETHPVDWFPEILTAVREKLSRENYPGKKIRALDAKFSNRFICNDKTLHGSVFRSGNFGKNLQETVIFTQFLENFVVTTQIFSCSFSRRIILRKYAKISSSKWALALVSLKGIHIAKSSRVFPMSSRERTLTRQWQYLDWNLWHLTIITQRGPWLSPGSNTTSCARTIPGYAEGPLVTAQGQCEVTGI